MTPPSAIADLVSRFDRNRDSYRSPAYNEEQLRAEFLNPLFIALGWDVYNTSGFAEPYKDVVFEQALKIGGGTKAPDYCFRIAGARKFFLEAKKPSLDLKDDPGPAYQLRRYAWSAKLPLSLLSDFEEFAVYDCRLKPAPTDKASAGRILYLTYDAYLDRWPEIAGVFSKDAVLKGSFDKFAETTKKKKGTAEVDSAFLKEIESWRETLAKNLALRNPKLTNRELNFAVQAIIDRIIFLRICGDRGIEEYTKLQELQNGNNIYKRLFHLFDEADDKYNSGLFNFRPEKDRPAPDTLTPKLDIDDKILKDILKSLYYPDSPYEFSVLPADILGQVYEQFLGKVIRLTPGHQAKVEAKPEVKKAGGVYYTPTYIVDYIVKNTVGKLLEGKTPAEVSVAQGFSPGKDGKVSRSEKREPERLPRASRGERGRIVGATGRSPLRILDPACGSGSFLLGAYQYLLDWYLNQYVAEGPEKHQDQIYQFRVPLPLAPRLAGSTGASWRLSTSERKRILLDHIYGVDIDQQAVEVTKLSLLLKCLEGETEESIHQLKLFYKQRALPDLSANIKCGNSLIGSDFFHNQQMTMFDQEEILRINAFDWEKEFSEVFNHKGTKEEAGFDVVIGNPPYFRIEAEKPESHYLRTKYNTSEFKVDIYTLFIEQFILRGFKYFGFIIPNTLMTNLTDRKLRKLILDRCQINEIVNYRLRVFDKAVVHSMLLFLEMPKGGLVETTVKQVTSEGTETFNLRQDQFSISENSFFDIRMIGKDSYIIDKLKASYKTIEYYCEIRQAIKTGDDDKYLSKTKDKDNFRPVMGGAEIARYYMKWGGRFVDYGKHLACPRDPFIYEVPEKILLRETGKRIIATLDTKRYYLLSSIYSVFLKPDIDISLKYILGIINSNLAQYFMKQLCFDNSSGAFTKARIFHYQQLPIRGIKLTNQIDKAQHDRMVELVETILDLHKRKAAAKVPAEREALERQIAATDGEIDGLVDELYGLTEEEIKIVEKG